MESKDHGSWQHALDDAQTELLVIEMELKAVTRRYNRMKTAVKLIQQQIAEQRPWPLDE
jgi:hypothetical protein